MTENNQNSSDPGPTPPIPKKARPYLAWIAWFIALAGPTAGVLIPILTDGKVATVLTGVLGFMVLAAASIKGGLSIPWKAPANPGAGQ